MGFKDWGPDPSGNPDFVKYAEAYGATGHRVANAESLPNLLASALEAPGVQLIEVPMDYSENDRILNHEIKQLSAAL